MSHQKSVPWGELRSNFVHDGRMKTIMKVEDLTVIDQPKSFLFGIQVVTFLITSDG